MKILLATLEYPPQIGGVASYYANLKNHWPQPDNFVILDDSKGELLAKRKLFPWFKSIKSIYRAFKRQKVDLVLIGQVLPLGTSASILSLFFSLRFGVIFHGLDYSLAIATPFKKRLTTFIVNRATLIICANSEVKRLLINLVPKLEQKIIISNPGAKAGEPDLVIIEELRVKYQLAKKKVIFSLGRLVRRKGFDRVIQSLELLDRDDFVYVICGQGEEKKYLLDLAQDSRHRERIIFIDTLKVKDNCNEAEKWAWLQLCDIFIMPSRNIDGDFEGFGIVYLEANLMAKPVIAGASGGVADAVLDGVNGLLINPEDNNAIAQAINTLLNNPELANSLGEQGKKRALVNFNWTKLATHLADQIKTRL